MTNPIAAIGAVSTDMAEAVTPARLPALAQPPAVSFYQLFSDGVDKVSEQANQADALVKAFVLDDSIAPHRVMYALEQSQLSLQLMLQVRNRLVEGYQEIMRMQL